MAAPRKTGRELQKLLASLPPDAKEKLSSLHVRYEIDDDQLECFYLNSGVAITADTMPMFADYLEEAKKAKAAKAQAPAQRQATTPGSKRRNSGAAILPSGMGAALGRADAKADAATPASKRMRESEPNKKDGAAVSPARMTPEPPPKPLNISMKSSVNEKLERPRPAANVGGVFDEGKRAPVSVTVLGDSALWTGKRRGTYEWMDESLEERTAHLDAQLTEAEGAMTALMCERHAGGEADVRVGAVGVPAQDEVVLCGRIACEGLEGRLNDRSMLLEGSRASSGGASMRLNVAECPEFVAFPGQVVSVLGRSGGMAGTMFHARQLLPGLPVPPRPEPRGEEPLHMIVAAGPFCLRAGLDYTPLDQILEYAVQEKPDVLVLLGPFLDATNQRVVAGDPTLPDDPEPCGFEDVYTQVLIPRLTRGAERLQRGPGATTEILVVPSLEETLCFHPLPQPPLDVSLGLAPPALEQVRRLGVHFLPNPAHVQIGSLRVSFSSADALSPLLREILVRPDGRKIEESLRQLLRQRTLFPVLPRDPAQVAESRASALRFPGAGAELPDMCVFPSQCGGLSGAFVDGTAFVNPGTLCRPAALGTFAEIWVRPPADDLASASFTERVRIDLQKLN